MAAATNSGRTSSEVQLLDHVDALLKKALEGAELTRDELVRLLELAPDEPASYRVFAAARRLSAELSGNRAEVHAQFALDLAPCSCNCKFCSFAASNGLFRTATRTSSEQAVAQALQFERDGANAVFVMSTAHYPLGEFLELSAEVRRHLRSETVMIANVGDQNLTQAQKLKAAGFQGVYHALRLREGVDTGLAPQRRRESLRNFAEAGLLVGTCVEPVGPEHSNEELADLILFTASLRPSFSGAARRITVPGGELAERGMITELRMAQLVAVTRLAMPRSTTGNCTHEPCTLGALAGANLFWAESGANPRDTRERTEEGRGLTVPRCREVFRESGWEVLEGPSRFYHGSS
jgi:biotin synthase